VYSNRKKKSEPSHIKALMPLLKPCRKLPCKFQFTLVHLLTHKPRVSDQSNSQLMVDIKSNPIQEEDGDASAALANVANTLRSVSDI
jgi:hypothetical protein